MAPIESKLFKPAERDQAYLKMGVKGFQGSGKTWTTYLVAKGLSVHLSPPSGEQMPLLYLDTEKGSAWLVDDAKTAGIPILASKTRVYANLLAGVDEAERLGGILVVDSLTHFAVHLAKDLRAEKGKDGMGPADFQKLNDVWLEFADRFVNSAAHIILCARAGWDYDESLDEEGNKVLEKLGTKFKGPAEIGFEPSLLVTMTQEPRGGGKARGRARVKSGKLWDYVAYIDKDRSQTIEGQRFENPTFDHFRPAIESLNLGGKHSGVDTAGSSRPLFRRERADVRL